MVEINCNVIWPKSFAFRGAKEWNNLDLRTKPAPSTHCFKSSLKDSKINTMG